MKKLLVAYVFTFLMTINTNAYGAGFGIRGGLNFSSISSAKEIALNNNYEGSTITALSDSYTGFHFGVVGYFPLLNVFIQPELLYTQTGQKMSVEHAPVGMDTEFTNKYSHVSLPVIAGPKFGPLRFGLGPVFSILLDSKQGYDEHMGDDLDFDHNRASMGYQVLLGLKAKNFLLDFKYEGSLSRLSDGVSIGQSSFDFDTRPRQFILSVGILLN